MWDSVKRIVDAPDEVYLDVVVLVLVFAAASIAIHLLVSVIRRPDVRTVHLRWRVWERLLYAMLVVAVVVLAGTAYFSVWEHGVLEGWLLMLHMAGAGTLVFAMPVAAIAWAQVSRFFHSKTASTAASTEQAKSSKPTEQFLWLGKVAFWVLLAAGFVNVSTMLLSMLPLFGTHGLEDLLTLHRYTGLAVVAALLLHCYAAGLARLGLR